MQKRGSLLGKGSNKPFRVGSAGLKKSSVLKILEGKEWTKIHEDEKEDIYFGFLTREFCLAALKSADGLRVLNRVMLGRMEDSIKHNEWLCSMPIVFSKYGKIRDGQHRLIAYRKSGCPAGKKVIVSVIKDYSLLHDYYAITGQQTSIQVQDILLGKGNDPTLASVAGNLLQFRFAEIGSMVNKRSSLLVKVVRENEKLLKTLTPLVHRGTSITSSMIAAAILVGRAYKKEDEAMKWLCDCSQAAFELIPENHKVNTVKMWKDTPLRTIAFWLAEGGASVIHGGKKASVNGTFVVKNGFSVIGNALIAALNGEKFTRTDIDTCLEKDAVAKLDAKIRKVALSNGVVLFGDEIN